MGCCRVVETGVGEDEVNECGSLGAAGVSPMKEAKPCPTLEQETFQAHASENAAEGSVGGAAASPLTPVGFWCP